VLTISSIVSSQTQKNMKFTIIATIFAALATTGYSAADADAIPVAAAVDETAPQGIMNGGSEQNHHVLRAKNDEAPEGGGAPPAATEGTGNKRALGTNNGANNKKDYSGQSCSLCCDNDYHC
jgi:hypothetical protein